MAYQKNVCVQEYSSQLGNVSDGNLQALSKSHSKKDLSLGCNGKNLMMYRLSCITFSLCDNKIISRNIGFSGPHINAKQ